MPGQRPGRDRPSGERSPEARQADHAAIDRLADDLLPSLVARLAASGLGELEVREGTWRVRLRRPAGADRRLPVGGRAAPGRSGSRSQADDARGRDTSAVGAAPATGRAAPPAPSGETGSDPLPPLTAVGPTTDPGAAHEGPAVATSPAVGIYRAAGAGKAGARLRAGDRLGTIDVLGVAVEVTSPVDGIVATILVEDGDAVEYGQPLVALQPLSGGSAGPALPGSGG